MSTATADRRRPRAPHAQGAPGARRHRGRQCDGQPRRHRCQRRHPATSAATSTPASSALQWVLTGYLLSLASLILLGGALGDRIGRRKVFVIGTVWFAAASALCGAAPSIEVLVVARILQGIGGALLTPGSLAILQASFRAVRPRRRSRRVVRTVGRRRRDRPLRRRRVGRRPWMALGVPAQLAGGGDHDRDDARGRARDPRSPPQEQLRRRRCRARRRRARGGDVGAHRGRPRGWTDTSVLVAGGARRRRRVRLRRAHPARRQPAGSAAAIPRSHLQRDQRDDSAALRRDRRGLLPRRLRTAGRRRLVGARGRRGPAADDAADAGAVGALGRARPTHRPAAAARSSALCSSGAGLLLLARIGPDASWAVDVLAGLASSSASDSSPSSRR